MSRKKFVYKQKIIKISEPQQKNLDELMATGRFVAESEIFREGLEMVYRKVSPPYLRPSIHEEVKREKVEKVKESEAQPDLDFVADNLDDVFIHTDASDRQWVLFIKLGNSFGAVGLDKVKEWVREAGPEYNYHKQMAGQSHVPYEEIFSDPTNGLLRQTLREMYGVNVPEPTALPAEEVV